MQVNGNGCEDSPSRYHIMPARTPGATPAATTASYALPGTPTLLEEQCVIKSESCNHVHDAAWVKSEIITVLELLLIKKCKDMHPSTKMCVCFGLLGIWTCTFAPKMGCEVLQNLFFFFLTSSC